MEKKSTGILLDLDVYECLQLKAGSFNQSVSSHLNYLLDALSKINSKDYAELLEKGIKSRTRKRYKI